MNGSPLQQILDQSSDHEIQIPATASYTLLVALEASIANTRSNVLSAASDDRDIHLGRLDALLDALRTDLDRRWAARIGGGCHV